MDIRSSFQQARDCFDRRAGEVGVRLFDEFGDRFLEDTWHGDMGEGVVRYVRDGAFLERASVNFSCIAGKNFPRSGLELKVESAPYRACGISLIMHPRSPLIPTTHLNVRMMVLEPKNAPSEWWLGGGYDLTPFIPFEEDCRRWHQSAFDLCRPYGDEVYREFKHNCDQYFYLPHRRETRGVGGIFFDHLNQWGWEKCFAYATRLISTWLAVWVEIAQRRVHQAYTEKQRAFQLYRRGRYVEFNLLYDRGTMFGLQSGGRTEAILASMPPLCSWSYRADREGGDLYPLIQRLRPYLRARDWLGIEKNRGS